MYNEEMRSRAHKEQINFGGCYLTFRSNCFLYKFTCCAGVRNLLKLRMWIVLEISMLRRIFGLEREEKRTVKMHNIELRNFLLVTKDRWGCRILAGVRSEYPSSVGALEELRPFGRCRRT